jgi:glyoxylase-like metal-dependent hydrolase (beta-lactamase superfamily II)
MNVIELVPRLYFIRLGVGHAYLWSDPDGLTLIDTGLPGSAPAIAEAIRRSGYQTADLRRLVLTHFHADHIGAAADIADWGGVEVLAHHADAPFIRAAASGPAPDLADWERPIYDQVMSQLPAGQVTPPRIDRELTDGDEPGFGDGAVVVAVPGHSPGSVALYLPKHQVLFTGDAAARSPDGNVMCGVFNVSRAQAASSFRRLAALDTTIACFGHGEPLTRNAAADLTRHHDGPSRLPPGRPGRAFPAWPDPAAPDHTPRKPGLALSGRLFVAIHRKVSPVTNPARQRGQARGQVRPGAASPVVASVAPALVVSHFLLRGTPMAEEQLTDTVDQVIMPLIRPPG